ncbi:Uncharacterised protein [Escherichia coli]|nr:Uncharacterised protein [Escherichia coli]
MVYQSRRFEKSLSKLPEAQLKVVEDEIDRIIDNPLWERKRKETSVFFVCINFS